MTTLKEFAVAVKDEISKRLGMEMEVKEVEKNNGVIKVGIVVTSPENRIAPNLYLEDYFEKYQDSEGTDKFAGICDEIEKEYVYYMNNTSSVLATDLEIDDISCYDKVKDRLYLKAVNANNGFLTTVPHKIIADDIAVYAIVAVKDDMTATTKVSYSLLEEWNVNFDIVFQLAKENSKQKVLVKGMLDTLAELQNVTVDKIRIMMGIPEEVFDEQVVISNKNKLFGASAIADNSVLSLAASKLGTTMMVILPSSIHELIGIPFNDKTNVNYINQMIEEINATQLSPEDVLSNHAYLYDGIDVRLLTENALLCFA